MLDYIAIIRSCTQHDFMETYGMRMRECTVPLSSESLLFSEHWVKSKIHPNLTAHCPIGPFPAPKYMSCILLCFSITIHEHTITLCCGAQKTCLIVANHLSNEDTFKIIHFFSTLQQQHIYDICLL